MDKRDYASFVDTLGDARDDNDITTITASGCGTRVLERLLRAVEPAEGWSIPEYYANVFTPVETLTYVAAHTGTIRLGTSIIDALFHVPVLLARRLATLDHFSAGRLVVGLGQGWSADEFATANVPMRRRGSGFEEFIEAMRATWGTDPVTYQGRFYRIAPSEVGPKPVQPGGPPILLAATPGVDAPAQRAGRLGLGLNPGISDWKSFEHQLATFRAAVPAGGRRGPIVVRVNNPVTQTRSRCSSSRWKRLRARRDQYSTAHNAITAATTAAAPANPGETMNSRSGTKSPARGCSVWVIAGGPVVVGGVFKVNYHAGQGQEPGRAHSVQHRWVESGGL